MPQELAGKTIAILATDGFEQAELVDPRRALLEAGATVHVVAPHDGPIQGMQHQEKGDKMSVDKTLSAIAAKQSGLVPNEIRRYFRDVQDHLTRTVEQVAYRQIKKHKKRL